MNELQLTISGVLDAVHAELEDARSERRSAQSKLAGLAPKKPREGAPPAGPEVPFEQLDRSTQMEQIEARYPKQ